MIIRIYWYQQNIIFPVLAKFDRLSQSTVISFQKYSKNCSIYDDVYFLKITLLVIKIHLEETFFKKDCIEELKIR